jgi:hypothetical protein
MAGKIFINYRRDESGHAAGRLYEWLARAFGADKLFMDVNNIPAGCDFSDNLTKQVAACDAMLAIIGPNWLNAKDEHDSRRLNNPDDFVAIEIAAGLALNIPVIPVLVDGARMPRAAELPDSLKPLTRRQALEVRHANFGRDAEALIARMREALGIEWQPKQAPKFFKRRWVRVTSAAVVLSGVAGLYASRMSGPDEASQPHEIEQKVVETRKINLPGLEISDITDELRKQHNIPRFVGEGAVVTRVDKDSLAFQEHVSVGDVIVKFDGHPVIRTGSVGFQFRVGLGETGRPWVPIEAYGPNGVYSAKIAINNKQWGFSPLK